MFTVMWTPQKSREIPKKQEKEVQLTKLIINIVLNK